MKKLLTVLIGILLCACASDNPEIPSLTQLSAGEETEETDPLSMDTYIQEEEKDTEENSSASGSHKETPVIEKTREPEATNVPEPAQTPLPVQTPVITYMPETAEEPLPEITDDPEPTPEPEEINNENETEGDE